MRERDERILNHIGRYRLSLRAVIDHVFFAADSAGCGNVLGRLVRHGFVRARDGLPDRRRYYQLTRRGAEGRVPLDRTRELRGQTLRGCLGILWFCCMTDRVRHRLELRELEKLFDPPPAGAHCIERGSVNRVYRCRVVGTKTRVDSLVRGLHEQIRRASDNDKVRPWLQNRNYGLAVLAESERIEEIRRALRRAALNDLAQILVREVPGPESLTRVIESWQRST